MTTQRLLHALLRHTATLIACLATRPGERTALADLPEQVRWSILTALRQRGLGPKIIADMFDVAPTTYHAWMRRGESTGEGTTLWGDVLLFIRENRMVDRATLDNAFRHEDPVHLRGIVNNLVDSGLVFKTGARRRQRFRAAEADELGYLDSPEATALLVWVVIYQYSREQVIDAAWLEGHLGLTGEEVASAVTSLVEAGRIIQVRGDDGRQRLSCAEYQIGFGHTAGWQAAILDHYQAMISTVCGKLCEDQRPPTADAETGGSTYVFDVYDGHPLRDEVVSLLRRYRRELTALRTRVSAHNRDAELDPQSADRVTVYIGQTIETPVVTEHDAEEG